MNQNLDSSQNLNNKEASDDDLKNVSYTYWKRETDENVNMKVTPQKNQPSLIEEPSKNNLGSVWNKAGTWEEKHLTKLQVEDFLNSKLTEKLIKIENSFGLNKISSYIGDVYYVFIRGKIKFVYDCEFIMKLSGENEFLGSEVEVKIYEVSNHSSDDDFEYDFSGVKDVDNQKASILKIFRKNRNSFQNFIRQMFDELKDSCIKNQK